jgi:hypothetical protein
MSGKGIIEHFSRKKLSYFRLLSASSCFMAKRRFPAAPEIVDNQIFYVGFEVFSRLITVFFNFVPGRSLQIQSSAFPQKGIIRELSRRHPEASASNIAKTVIGFRSTDGKRGEIGRSRIPSEVWIMWVSKCVFQKFLNYYCAM